MADIVESLVLQELSGRIRERRNNIKTNQSLLRNPNKLNNVIKTMGVELLTENQLENINQDVFRRDPVVGLDGAFNESDPRRGSLNKIRESIRKFISDPKNQHVAPEKIFSTAFKSEQTRAQPELTRLFNESGLLGGKKFDPEVDIKFPLEAQVSSEGTVQPPSSDPGGDFADIAGAAIRGAITTPVENFGSDVLLATGTTAATLALAKRARSGVRGRTAFGRGIQKAALKATGGAVVRKGVAASAIRAIAGGLNFVPHPVAKVAGRLLLATAGGFSAFSAGQGLVKEAAKEAFPGIDESSPIAFETLGLVGGAAGSSKAVLNLARNTLIKNTFARTFKGKASETVELGKLEKTTSEGKSKLLDRITESSSIITGRRAVNKAKTQINTDLQVIEKNQDVVTRARSLVGDRASQLGQIGRVKGLGTEGAGGTIKVTPVPFPKVGNKKTRSLFTDSQKDISQAQKSLPGFKPKGLLTAGEKTSAPVKPKVISGETATVLQKEVEQIKKVGPLKLSKKRRSETVTIDSKADQIVVKSASDVVEDASTVMRQRVRTMTDDAIPTAVKGEFNKTYLNLIKQGHSEAAASKVIVDMGNKFKETLKPKNASQIFEEQAAKSAKRVEKQKPKKEEAQRFAVDATDEVDKIVADGAAKLGKEIEDLTLSEFESIISKGGKVLGLIGTAIAAGALLPEDSEASVISGLGKVATSVAERAESNAIKNISNKFLKKKGESETDFIERMLKQARKTATSAINSSERQASKLTFNAKNDGFNLDKETARRSTVNFIDRAFGSVFNNYKKMGPTGEVLTNKFIQVDDFSEISSKAINRAFREALPVSKFTGKLMTNLPKKEGKVIHDILTGATTRGPRAEAESAVKLRGILDDVFTFAEKEGVPVVGKRQNYFPQILKEGVLETDRGRAQLINHFIKTGQVEDVQEAFELTTRFLKDRFHNVFNEISRKAPVKIAGRLEKSRQYDIPPELYLGGDGKNVLEALSVYAHQVTLRVGRIKAFGVNNEKLEAVVKRLVKDGQDEQFLRNSINVMLGNKPLSFRASKQFNRAIGISRAIEAVDLLGFAGPSQLAQITFTLAKTGPTATFKGIKNLITSQKTKEMVDSSAAVADTMSRFILEQFGAVTGASKKATETALKAYGVLGIDRMGRSIAAAAGGEYTFALSRTLLKEGIKNTPKSKLVQRQLKELDLNPTIMLRNMQAGKQAFTDDNLRVAMKRISDMTQFRSRPGDLPLWFSSDHAKLITQFKSFLFQSGSAVNQLMIKEAKRGNFKPLAIATSVSPFVGSTVQEIRQTMKEMVGSVAGESQAEIKKKGKFRKDQIKKGKFFTEPRDWMGGSSISRLWNDATYTLALGVLPDVIENLLAGKGVGKAAVGPNVDRVFRALNAVHKDLDDGNFEHVKKELGRLTPLGINQ